MSTMAERFRPMPALTLDQQLNFWNHVSGYGTEGCWLWTGSLYDNRYGRFTYGNVGYCAHRVSYRLHYGVDPGPLYVCHECNNTKCINPHHLYLDTNQGNIQYSYDSGTRNQNGILNPQAKLNESNVRTIRERYKSETIDQICKDYPVTRMAIQCIVKFRTWRHVQ
jgi:hypothetical protein